MGEVWLAEDRLLGNNTVALKFVRPDWRRQAWFIDNLRKEVLLTRAMNHPAIVRVHDWHQEEEEPPFMSMEYVEGVPLSEFIDRQPNRRLGYAQFHAIFLSVCEALDYAHRTAQIVHRDLKPGNILISETAGGLVAKVADFGLASPVVDDSQSEAGSIQRGGTPSYMSPRQWKGLPPAPADDVYALGVTMYQALTGRLPWDAGAQERNTPVPFGQLHEQEQAAKEVPAGVLMAVSSCLEVEEALRTDTASRMLQELRKRAPRRSPGSTPRKEGGVVPEVVDPEPPPPPPPPPGYLGWALVGVSLLLGAAMAWRWDLVLHFLRPERRQVRELAGSSPPSESSAPSAVGNEDTRVPSTNSTPSVAPQSPGRLSISVRTLPSPRNIRWVVRPIPDNDSFATVDIRYEMTRSRPCPPGLTRQRGYDWLVLPACPPGRYLSWIEIGTNTVHSNLLVVASGASVEDRFEVNTIDNPRAFLSTLPSLPDTEIHYWQGIPAQRDPPTLYEGLISITARVPSYFDFSTNFEITPAIRRSCQNDGLRLPLRRSLYPLPSHVYSNSFDQFFLPLVGPASTNPHCWFAQAEVTKEHFETFLRSTGHPSPSTMRTLAFTQDGKPVMIQTNWDRPALFKLKPTDPVIGVSWADAIGFCDWLTHTERSRFTLKSNQVYSLPTFSQWHWARGNITNHHHINVGGPELKLACSDHWPWKNTVFEAGRDKIEFLDSALIPGVAHPDLRLFHMDGNVQEWCLDLYEAGKNSIDVLEAYDWTLARPGPKDRAVCGGSWYDGDPLLWRPGTTMAADPDICTDYRGFRVVILETRNAPTP